MTADKPVDGDAVYAWQDGKGPFARLCAASVFDLKLSAAAVRVLAALATYVDWRGMCWPSVDTLAERLRVDARQIQRHLRALEARGYVRIEERKTGRRGGNSTNLYVLKFPACEAAPSPQDSRSDGDPGDPSGEGPIASSDDLRPNGFGAASGDTPNDTATTLGVASKDTPKVKPPVRVSSEGTSGCLLKAFSGCHPAPPKLSQIELAHLNQPSSADAAVVDSIHDEQEVRATLSRLKGRLPKPTSTQPNYEGHIVARLARRTSANDAWLFLIELPNVSRDELLRQQRAGRLSDDQLMAAFDHWDAARGAHNGAPEPR